jgi:type IV fimbrial biogenesis protein FimT
LWFYTTIIKESRKPDGISHKYTMNSSFIKQRGFTMVELLITVSILGILSAMAYPSFNEIIRNNRRSSYANDLLAAINVARSEAIKRNAQVTIQRLGSTAGQWESGWTVFVDSDSSGAFNDNGTAPLCEMSNNIASEDCLLKTYPALLTGFTLRTGTTFQHFIAFSSSGLSVGAGVDTFRVCDPTADNTKSRAIIVSTTGRARVSKGTASCP